MKLFTRYNRLNLLATVLIFLFSSIAYYYLLRYVIVGQFDENLEIEKAKIESFVKKYNKFPEIIPVKDQLVLIKPVKTPTTRSFKTVSAFDTIGNDIAEFRELFFPVTISSRWYDAMVGKSMEGAENLIQSIVIITIITILVILLVSFFINRIVLNKLWQPFYNTLQLIKDFKVGRSGPFHFPKSNTEEFSFMNGILQQAIVKADGDYLILKEFTENASHEMQTPLAILRSKLDLLVQDEHISQSHDLNIQALYRAIEKLSKLNRSLLLLTKIENNQFVELARINLKEKLNDKILQFQEIFAEKNLVVSHSIAEVAVQMNADLIDILLNNLFSNAIKHNIPDGKINIILTREKSLKITNTGFNTPLDMTRIFSRFYKAQEGSEHLGLGLSILKQICIVSGCTIEYNYQDQAHSFTVKW